MLVRTKGEYFGQLRLAYDRPGSILSAYDYLAPETVWHYHENPYFMYVLHGNIYEVNKGGRSPITKGSLIFHNWQDPHQNCKASTSAAGFHVELERTWLKQMGLSATMWEGSQILENPRLHQLIASLFLELMAKDDSTELQVELQLLQLCAAMSERQEVLSKYQPPWVAKLRDLLEESEEIPSLQDLSDLLGVHPVHLSRAIPKYFGQRFGEYLRMLKLRKAFPLLLNDDKSLSEVGYLAGFADQSHFNRICKQYLGNTAGAIRRKVKNKRG
ncbi:MAG: AraC family transcriptional regulator [Bacteroidota bacterium]